MIDGRCGAHRRDGKPCTQFPMKGKARCKMHGGKSTGPKKPHKSHGAYELVAKHQRHPKPRPDAVAKMTEAEQLRAKQIERMSDVEILDLARGLLIVALERAGYSVDATSKISNSLSLNIRSRAAVTTGEIQRHVFDPALTQALGIRIAEAIFERVQARIADREILRLIATDLGTLDWSAYALPTIADTQPVGVEQT